MIWKSIRIGIGLNMIGRGLYQGFSGSVEYGLALSAKTGRVDKLKKSTIAIRQIQTLIFGEILIFFTSPPNLLLNIRVSGFFF